MAHNQLNHGIKLHILASTTENKKKIRNEKINKKLYFSRSFRKRKEEKEKHF